MSCAYCHHVEKKHCKGEVRHQNYKDAMRQVPNSRTTICHTRHCEEPLCDCLGYVEAAIVAPAAATATTVPAPKPGIFDF
jgi:hypothetical protein